MAEGQMFEPEESGGETEGSFTPPAESWPPRLEELERLITALEDRIEWLDPDSRLALWGESDQDYRRGSLVFKYIVGLEHLKLGVCYLQQTANQLRIERQGR